MERNIVQIVPASEVLAWYLDDDGSLHENDVSLWGLDSAGQVHALTYSSDGYVSKADQCVNFVGLSPKGSYPADDDVRPVAVKLGITWPPVVG